MPHLHRQPLYLPEACRIPSGVWVNKGKRMASTAPRAEGFFLAATKQWDFSEGGRGGKRKAENFQVS